MVERLDQKELSDRLQAFGLSFDESRVYVLLSLVGEQEATGVARMMGMARSAVYPVFQSLEEKGLVEVAGGAVKKYSARSLAPFLDAGLKKAQDRLTHLSRQRAFLVDALGSVRSLPRNGVVQAIEQPALVAQQIRGMAEKAGSELLVLLNGEWSAHVGESFAMAAPPPQARGVCLRVLTRLRPDNLPLVKGYWPADAVRHTEMEPITSVVVRDGEEAVLVKPVPEVIDFAYLRNYALWTDDNGLVETLRSLVLREWERAIPLERWEKEVGRGRR